MATVVINRKKIEQKQDISKRKGKKESYWFEAKYKINVCLQSHEASAKLSKQATW